PVVVDARPNEAITLATDRQVRAAREYRVEMRADDHRWEIVRPTPTSHDVSDVVGFNLRQAAVGEATSDPTSALVFLTSRGGDLCDRDLGAENRVIAGGQ